jgi:hypothetical protein
LAAEQRGAAGSRGTLDEAIARFRTEIQEIAAVAKRELEEQVQSAAATLERRLEESFDRHERQLTDRMESRIASQAARERLEAAVARIEGSVRELTTRGVGPRDEVDERLAADIADRIATGVAKISARTEFQATGEIDQLRAASADAIASVDESRSEAMRAIESAAARATEGVEAAGAQAKAGLFDRESRLATIERRARENGTRIEHAMARAERAVARIEKAERRLAGAESRMRETERRMKELAETAARAADWEERIWAAIHVEDQVARRIQAAEERILRVVESPMQGEARHRRR